MPVKMPARHNYFGTPLARRVTTNKKNFKARFQNIRTRLRIGNLWF